MALVAADLLHVVEGLGPILALVSVPCSSLLCPVGKNTGQLPFAGVFDSPGLIARVFEVRLVAESWEFGDSLEEVVIGVDVVGKRECEVPLFFSHEALHSLDIFASQVICDRAVDCERGSETAADCVVVGVGNAILDSILVSCVIKVIVRPETVLSNCGACNARKEGKRANLDDGLVLVVHCLIVN